jgi:hypothetical protein
MRMAQVQANLPTASNYRVGMYWGLEIACAKAGIHRILINPSLAYQNEP